jgi:hypothetical protein
VLAGRREEAEKVYDRLPPNTLSRAMFWAAAQDKERLLEEIASAAWAGPVLMGRVLTFPEFQLIRGDAKLKEIYRKVGLPN